MLRIHRAPAVAESDIGNVSKEEKERTMNEIATTNTDLHRQEAGIGSIAAMPSKESKSASLDKPLVPETSTEPTSSPAHRRRRWPLILGVIVAVALIFVGVPPVIHAVNTGSTHDAHVNGYLNV